ncbi:MAG TPA: hypothetical protein PKM63_17395 [Panacibacter sp.]|nr:hypothetical protein [Panacibacter sp.]HNP46072.1 hypothetical protein [Panacibacter sp.]
MFHSKSDQRSDELNEWNEPINFFSDAEDSNLNSVAPEDDSLELSGPSQPEMTSFKSVGNDNMVDLFTGDFSYNIPLLDVGGYPVNLFYRSGISMDQEASWVGLGWNINPGTITRNLRGLPDDFDGSNDKITKTGSIKENKTIGTTLGADAEIYGLGGLGGSIGAFHNTYKGWGLESGLNASLRAGNSAKGGFTGGLSLSLNNNTQDGLTITPGLSVSLTNYGEADKEGITGSLSTSMSYNTRAGLKGMQLNTGVGMSRRKIVESIELHGSGAISKSFISQGGISASIFSSSISFAASSYTPTITLPYTSKQITFTGKVGGELWGVDGNVFLSGYMSSNKIADADTTISMPAYGYINYQSAKNNPSALLDFNMEKDIPYHEKPAVPNIGIPAYTYDLFSISGEGTGGMFRGYRGDIGFVYDHLMSTKSESDAVSADVGIGTYFHGGVDLNQNNAYTQTGPWIKDNALKQSIDFKKSDSVFEAVYFRNPGEKAINTKDFYDAVGGDDVVTPDLYQPSVSSPYILATNKLKRYKNSVQVGTSVLSPMVYKKSRDKRSEVITYLTAQEASTYGFSKYIEDYGLNKWGLRNCNKNFTGSGDTLKINDTITIEKRINSFRKPNHISEIDVLNPDGRRYVYGIPVYNLLEKDVTASVAASNASVREGLVKYNIDSSNPIKYPDTQDLGRDNYFNKELIPAYAHSYLLTSILSNDYVDITGDGITDDDLGDAIKINYTKTAGIANPYQWRAPYVKDSVTYNEGLRTDKRDDRASYVYGQKELWYINSIESKNMIATFKLASCADRLPADETGAKQTSTASQKLVEINLYSKADFLQNNDKAKPIKTIHFDYAYSLCRGINGSINDSGKLTLVDIYFTYNGGSKKQNYYKFYYNGINPRYSTKSNDRWGTYKDPLDNPGSSTSNYITNGEFPYAVQDSAIANKNVRAWTLDSILLPSKASIKVTYESDDYAYVQNKRAMQMFKIAGFGNDTATIRNNLYDVSTANGYLTVFAKVAQNVTTNQEVFDKYLQGISKLYFRISIGYGAGYEFVPVYADIDLTGGAGVAYGRLASDPKKIWFKIKGIDISATKDGSYSPLAKAGTEFLRLNLPSLAYPNSEVGDKPDLKQAISMAGALLNNLRDVFTQFDISAMKKGMANTFDSSRSFVRLNAPFYKKYGGGLRVKKVEIYDAWNSMTTQKESKYGQQYSYTTVKQINGVPTVISSGVASYEPSIGGEENPWKQPIEYIEKVAPLAPTSMGYTETPLGEGFFPAPVVGYSEVKVRTIHVDTVRSASGYDITKFFTTYDFPTITDFTPLIDNKKRYKPAIANFLHINAKHFLAVSQGFKIELNDMNGKLRSQASYPQTDSTNAIAYSENFYKVDDPNAESKHLLNTVSVVDASGTIDTTAIIGKDVELMVGMREQRSVTEGANIQVNVDVIPALLVPFPIPSLWYMPVREEDQFRSVAVTKVIQRYGILDSMLQIDKGSRVGTKNLLFDSETGDVLLTRTMNEFNDPVYNFTYPAHWAYSGMGPAYKNVQAIFSSDAATNIVINNGSLNTNAKYPSMQGYFESGDEIIATGQRKTGETTPVDCNGNQKACPTNIYTSTYTTEKIWAVDTKKVDPSSTVGIVFIDTLGKPYSADSLSLKIVRSGKRNMSMNPVASTIFLTNPIQTVSGKLKLFLDSNSNVLTSSAVPFYDIWKVKDARKSMTFDNTCTCGPLKALFDYLIASHRLFIQASAGITVDSIARAASVDINSCGILSSNKYGLFYALTSSTTDTIYRAQIGNSVVSIRSNVGKQINFYSLQSKTCVTGDNRVYYQDNSTTVHSIKLINNNSDLRDIYYLYCPGTVNGRTDHMIVQGNSTSVCFYSTKFANPLPSGVDTALCTSNPDQICDTNAIFLSIQNCTSCPSTNCYSPILDTTINPYTYGIFGNWRSNKSYVYYGDRQQTDFSLATNIRKNGAIKSFVTYWSFGSQYLSASTDTTRWVWNAQTTLFSKKGYELENKDPLGRYNSGLYGYNETLPISVTQNAKYREQVFDGFEDYGYDNKPCVAICPIPRLVNFINGGSLDQNNAHSGKFSLKISAGQTDSVLFSVVATFRDTASTKMIANITTKSMVDTIVNAFGTGLTPLFYSSEPKDPNGNEGYYIAPATGNYTLKSTRSYARYLSNTGQLGYGLYFNSTSSYSTASGGNPEATKSAYLVKGQKAYIKIAAASSTYFTNALTLQISKDGCDGWAFDTIPIANLGSSPSTVGNVTYSTSYCNSFTGIKTDSTILNPNTSFTAGGKYWFSAWVKEEQNCLCQNYTNNQVAFVFTDNTGAQTIYSTKPKDNIIEGWQRYDTAFTIPTNAVSVTIKMKATGSSNVYFDDIRMIPDNSNMQSFVYHPVNLRLMAQLDENNYATFYEYDDDGTLIRVKKETERGIKTIKETRSYLVK